jgi:hypothetical protein
LILSTRERDEEKVEQMGYYITLAVGSNNTIKVKD